VAILAPGLVTLLSFVPRVSFGVAALAYVLAVVVASTVGGIGAGLLATVLSFFALNLLFTDPRHTFDIEKVDDLFALAVFVVVASLVGSIVGTAVRERTRAERREEEARLLHHLGTRLIGGEAIEDVFRRFAEAVTDLFGLARCEIRAEQLANPIAVAGDAGASPEHADVVPMMIDGDRVGEIGVAHPDGRPLSQEERHVVELFAGQMALALRGVQLTSAVLSARSEAEVSRARSALFSSVTHDLRTPLASILGSATSLLDPESDLSAGDRRDLLETIRQEAERLNRLVGNILQLSRLRAGALVPQRLPGSIEEVVDQVISRLGPTLRQHRVRVEIPEDLPDVPFDVVQIDQALTNLIENAARMSPPGTQIAVSAARSAEGVVVSVSDEGPGIAPGEREIVFEPFRRGSAAKGPGSGLGLPIARAIVEAHGGRLWLDEAPPVGTTVMFELPAEQGRAPGEVRTERPPAR
jgi:two-component system sensor histidine kinase KdpD